MVAQHALPQEHALERQAVSFSRPDALVAWPVDDRSCPSNTPGAQRARISRGIRPDDSPD